MKLKKIKLENIRSFLDQEITFPKGSILLSGDIGSGKSSILLAVEFALFGLMRSDLSGNQLLRNGARTGSVVLNFNVQGKEVEVKRTLKGGKSVNQDSGYIVVDGNKEELTPNEIKQRILELLNYPKELITRSKSLIYRYTIYTPQEDMKKILTGNKEDRLDTLRKVFGFDKYKRVKDNTKILSTYLREKKKMLEGKTEDLERLRIQGKELEERKNDLNSKKKNSDSLMKDCRLKLDEKKIELLEAEKFRKFGVDMEILDKDLKSRIERQRENLGVLKKLEKEISNLEKEKPEKSYLDDIEKVKKELSGMQDNLFEKNNEMSYLKAGKENSQNTKKKINELDICPVCKQEVTEKHKHSILEEEDKNISEKEKDMENIENEIKELKDELRKKDELLEELNEKQKGYEVLKVKLENLNEKTTRKDEIEKYNLELKKKIGEINSRKQEIYKDMEKAKKGNYEKIKEEFEKISDELKNFEIENAGLDARIEGLKENLDELRKDIKKKEKVRKEIANIDELNNWVGKTFLNLMNMAERKIMLRVYHDFNNLFQKWFNILVDSENLEIKLDEEFSPLIIQNGYDMEYDYLSGGEKTAAALAYRLSLNQVINNLIVNISTNDMIILDEPTDGFSEEQLERMRLVLEELNINQILIVSHEAKIESFVDNVIRLKKENHVSRVL